MNRLFVMVFGLMLSLVALAQAPEAPVRWQVTVRMTSATEGTAVFKARLQPGWHLYGMQLPQGGPKPTVIDLAASKGVKFTSPLKPDREPLTVHDKMFGIDLNWWDSDIVIRRKFTVTDPSDARIAGKITYMGCNDQTCSPPSDFKFDKPVPKSHEKDHVDGSHCAVSAPFVVERTDIKPGQVGGKLRNDITH